MEAKERYIEFYRDVHGRSHFHEWLLNLPKHVRAHITERIARVSRGVFGDIKPVGEGVSELRIHVGPGYRVYIAIGDKNILILAGSVKADQERTIQLALNLWKEYKSKLA